MEKDSRFYIEINSEKCQDSCESCPALRKVTCIMKGDNSDRFQVYRKVECDKGENDNKSLGTSRTLVGAGRILGAEIKGSSIDPREIDTSNLGRPEMLYVGISQVVNGDFS